MFRITNNTLVGSFCFFNLVLAGCQSGTGSKPMNTDSAQVKLVTLDPGHFHAALVQKTMLSGIDSTVQVYAPDGPELKSHLDLVNGYNSRTADPTRWREEVYTGSDFLDKMLTQKDGNVVVMSGNNKRKTEYISRTVNAGKNVLGDKPMAIDTANFRLLAETFRKADQKKVLLYDIMTERSEITNILQRELSRIPALFGTLEKGTLESPAVEMESVHHFFKSVSGNALKRPAWFFDAEQQGNAIVDVGTHLADLVQWECFPDSVIDYEKDIRILRAKRWPAPLTLSQFRGITKLDSFPDYLRKYVSRDSILNTDANGSVDYTIKGIHIRITPLWNYQAPGTSGDTHYSILKGTKANLVIRQGKEENYQPTVYIEPAKTAGKTFSTDVQQAIKTISETYPGITVEKSPRGFKLLIPDQFKIGHEAHFAQVMERYLAYLKQGKLPGWEVPGMLAKYYVTTYGSAAARQQQKQ